MLYSANQPAGLARCQTGAVVSVEGLNDRLSVCPCDKELRAQPDELTYSPAGQLSLLGFIKRFCRIGVAVQIALEPIDLPFQHLDGMSRLGTQAVRFPGKNDQFGGNTKMMKGAKELFTL